MDATKKYMSLEDFSHSIASMGKVTLDDDRLTFEMENETGRGSMIYYLLLPGIFLIQNDFTMDTCDSKFVPCVEMLSIDHCLEGRLEWSANRLAEKKMESGLLHLDSRKNHTCGFSFPLGRYRGVTIGILIEDAKKGLQECASGISIDLLGLRSKLCPDENTLISCNFSNFDFDFSPFYQPYDEKKKNYIRAKVLELLTYLDCQENVSEQPASRYYHKEHVDKVREIASFICNDVQNHHTLSDLSEQFGIPLTTMKQCFKDIYGVPIYSYLRRYRMTAAAMKLRITNYTVAEIALSIGYENASKFAAAFKAEIGLSPQEYRLREESIA